jgi:hypothetical protein
LQARVEYVNVHGMPRHPKRQPLPMHIKVTLAVVAVLASVLAWRLA